MLMNTSLFLPLEEFTIDMCVCLVSDASMVPHACVRKNKRGSNYLPNTTINDATYNTTLVNGRHTILTIGNNSQFRLMYDQELVINWHSLEIRTNLAISEGVWTYIALTWRMNDGKLTIYRKSPKGSQSIVRFNVQAGYPFVLQAPIVFGQTLERNHTSKEGYDMIGALDEFRLWQYELVEQELDFSMTQKLDLYVSGLVMAIPFDEGFGVEVNATIYGVIPSSDVNDDITRNITKGKRVSMGYYPSTSSPKWLPSAIDMGSPANYSAIFEDDELRKETVEVCYAAFFGGPLKKYCSQLRVQVLFYYDACISDVASSDNINNAKISVGVFGLYCQRVLGIEECLLYGTYDGFPPCVTTKKNTIVNAYVIVGSLFGLLFLLILLVFCVRRRKKKSQTLGRVGRSESDIRGAASREEQEEQHEALKLKHAYIFMQPSDTSENEDEVEKYEMKRFPRANRKFLPPLAHKPLLPKQQDIADPWQEGIKLRPHDEKRPLTLVRPVEGTDSGGDSDEQFFRKTFAPPDVYHDQEDKNMETDKKKKKKKRKHRKKKVKQDPVEILI